MFKEVFVSFFFVGHTDNDIDASFGWWSMKLHEEDFPSTLDEVVLYMDLDNISINPHMMKEVLNLKAFIEPYPRSGAHHLFGHTKAQ